MLRKWIAVLSLGAASLASAEGYQCSVTPQDDLVITPAYVQVIGKSGEMKITPDGQITRDGKSLTLSAAQSADAKRYQSGVRQDVPWIKQQAVNRIGKSRQAVDKVLIKEMGQDSKLRGHLTTLEADLNKQVDRIIETRPDGYAFHHQAIKQVEQDGRAQIQQRLGGMLQDAINEIGRKQLLAGLTGDKNAAGAALSGLDGLQKSLQQAVREQEGDFKQFSKQVCGKVTTLEQQRLQLMNSLK